MILYFKPLLYHTTILKKLVYEKRSGKIIILVGPREKHPKMQNKKCRITWYNDFNVLLDLMIHLYSAPSISTPFFVNCLYNLEVLANLDTATAFDIFTRYDFLTLTGEVLSLFLFYIHPRICLLFGSKKYFSVQNWFSLLYKCQISSW